MRNPDVRASRVALIADAIVNRLVPGADEAVDALVAGGYGFLMLPPHDMQLVSTRTTIEFIVDDAVDYRRHDYSVIIVSVSDLPQRGVWIDVLAEELFRRSESPFDEIELADVVTTIGVSDPV